MNGIGIIIGRINKGALVLHVSPNASEYQRYFTDNRAYIKQISPNDEYEFVNFLSFGENVAFININKSISGRGGDVATAMITVPSALDIPGEDIEKLFRYVKDELKKTQYNYNEMDSMFSKEYMPSSIPFICSAYKANVQACEFAYKMYGSKSQDSLVRIFDALFQKYYFKHKAVFLIDDTYNNPMNKNMEDYSTTTIVKYLCLKYPKNLPADVEIKINNEPLTKDIVVERNKSIEVEYKYSVFEPIKENDIPTEYCIIDRVNKGFDWKIILKKEHFKSLPPKADINVNDKKVDGKAVFSEKELIMASVRAQCQYYKDYVKKQNIVNAICNGGCVEIKMEKKQFEQKYMIGDRIWTTLIDEGTQNKCPLNGYKFSQRQPRSNQYIVLEQKQDGLPYSTPIFRPEVKQGGSMHYTRIILLSFAIGVVLAVGVFLTIKYCSNGPEPPVGGGSGTVIDTSTIVVTDPAPDPDGLSEEALTYLRDHKAWKRSEMEKISPLEQLFDDVNNRRYSSIKDNWNDKLKDKGIPYWDDIMKLTEEGKLENQKFDKKNEQITMEFFIKRTGNYIAPTPSPTPSPTPDVGSNGNKKTEHDDKKPDSPNADIKGPVEE